jgi:hypothetical protein
MKLPTLHLPLRVILLWAALFLGRHSFAASVPCYGIQTLSVDPGYATWDGTNLFHGTLSSAQAVYYASGAQVTLKPGTEVYMWNTGYLEQGVLNADASVLYGASRTVVLAANTVANFSAANVVHGTLSATDQALIYNVTASPDKTVTMQGSSEIWFEPLTDTVARGILHGNQSLDYGYDSKYENGPVALLGETQIWFENEKLLKGYLNGNQTFFYGQDAYAEVVLAGGSLAIFQDDVIYNGEASGDQSMAYDLASGGAAVNVWSGGIVQFSLRADGHLLTVVSNDGITSMRYIPGSLDTINVSDGGIIIIDSATHRLVNGVLEVNQVAKYSISPSRTASVKGECTFNPTTGVLVTAVSSSSQTLTTSGGTSNVVTNQALSFSGGYYVP